MNHQVDTWPLQSKLRLLDHAIQDELLDIFALNIERLVHPILKAGSPPEFGSQRGPNRARPEVFAKSSNLVIETSALTRVGGPWSC